jgi:hypothetical protein
MDGIQLIQSDAYYGRAVARVLAHELYHSLTGITVHSRSAMFSPVLNVLTLLDEAAVFERAEIERVQTCLSSPAKPH